MNRKRNKFYYIWSLSIIICVILAVFSIIFASCSTDGKPKETEDKNNEASQSEILPESDISTETGDNTEPSGSGDNNNDAPEDGQPTSEPQNEPEQAPASVELGTTADAGAEYIDSLTFLGDSTTYGLKAYGVLSDHENTTQVWTPSSGTLTLSNQSFATIVYPETGEEITIEDAARRKKPEYLVITLGVNGVSFMDEEYFKSEYTKLINSVLKVSPETKIICNSIYPVTNYYQYLDSINNTKIENANRWIRAVAEETGTHYLDSASVLKDSGGWLKESYCNGDGIHLSSAGFLEVLEYMRTHALT